MPVQSALSTWRCWMPHTFQFGKTIQANKNRCSNNVGDPILILERCNIKLTGKVWIGFCMRDTSVQARGFDRSRRLRQVPSFAPHGHTPKKTKTNNNQLGMNLVI